MALAARAVRVAIMSSIASQPTQHVVERCQHQIGILPGEGHGRADLCGVLVDAELAHQHTTLAHAVDDPRGDVRGGRLFLPVEHQFGPEEQAAATHIADQRVFVRQLLQPRTGIGADMKRVLLQLLLLQHVEHGHRRSAGDRIAAKKLLK